MRIYHVDVPRFSLLLVAVDVAVVALAAEISVDGGFGRESVSHLLTLATCLCAPAFAMGLYQRAFLEADKLLVRACCALAVALILAFVASEADLLPRFTAETALLAVGGIAAMVATRLLFCRIASGTTFKRRVLVVGGGRAPEVVAELERKLRPSRYQYLGALDATAFSDGDDAGGLLATMRARRANEIVLAPGGGGRPMMEALLTCRLSGVRITPFATFIERETRRVDVEDEEALRLLFSEGAQRNALSRAVKRALDVVASAAILAFTLPVTVATAIAIRLDDGGPIFYRQDRVGFGGRVIRIIKFRTMRVDAESDGVARWATTGDARMTSVGRFLRLSRIDELPQLINVLRGDMSLVGPRPERPQITADLEREIPFYAYRHLTPPGLTGWAQINYPYGASLEDAREKTRYDLYYLKNGSVLLDLVILLQTVRVVLMAEGSR